MSWGGRRSRSAGWVALRRTLAAGDVRRLTLSSGAFNVGEFATLTVYSVYALDRGGAAAVGIFALATLLPAAALAPVAAMLVDRFRRRATLITATLARVAATAAAAAAIVVDAPLALVIALAAADTVVTTAIRPATSALLATLSRSPSELTAANASGRLLEGAAQLIAPLLAAAVLSIAALGPTLAAMALPFVVAVGLLALIRTRELPPGTAGGVTAREPWRHAIAQGLRFLRDAPEPRQVVGLLTALDVARGAASVLLVAIPVDLLDQGEGGVGLFLALLGGGAFAGGLLSMGLAGRERLALALGWSLVAWGAALAALGIAPSVVVAAVFVIGLGGLRTVGAVAATTLVQRLVPNDVLGRVLGVHQTVRLLAIAAGAAIVPVLIEIVGLRGATLVVAMVLVAGLLVRWRVLRGIDAEAHGRGETIELLRAQSLFGPLDLPALDRLAGQLRMVSADAGEYVIRQGDDGDEYYLVRSGTLDVEIDGAHVTTLGTGDGFGEIALLREVPRTACVIAREPCELAALDRAAFLAMAGADRDGGGLGGAGVLGAVWRPAGEVRARRIDADDPAALLGALPLFSRVDREAIAALASGADTVDLAPGEAAVREGEPARRFYVIARGSARVTQGGHELRELGPGDGFGELAILHDVRRTATVTAVTDLRLHALERTAFLGAVAPGAAGAEQSATAAARLV